MIERGVSHRILRATIVVAVIASLLPVQLGRARAGGGDPPMCFGKPATIVVPEGASGVNGTPGPDVIVGTDRPDDIRGLGGDDRICGLRGPGEQGNMLFGGPGRDRISGGADGDYLVGGPGHDVLYTGGRSPDGMNETDGGRGNDLIIGGPDEDLLADGPSDDVLKGRGGADDLNPGPGRDRLYGGRGAEMDIVRYDVPVRVDLASATATGDGMDRLFGIELFWGSKHDDVFLGSEGDDLIIGYYGDDTLRGRGGDDCLIGHDGHNVVRGGRGLDTIDFDVGRDPFFCSPDTETVGGPGNEGGIFDLVNGVVNAFDSENEVSGLEGAIGTHNNDTFVGNDGPNWFYGNGGSDDMSGNGGDDFLDGGPGADSVDGGADTDRCLNAEAPTNCEELI